MSAIFLWNGTEKKLHEIARASPGREIAMPKALAVRRSSQIFSPSQRWVSKCDVRTTRYTITEYIKYELAFYFNRILNRESQSSQSIRSRVAKKRLQSYNGIWQLCHHVFGPKYMDKRKGERKSQEVRERRRLNWPELPSSFNLHLLSIWLARRPLSRRNRKRKKESEKN